MSEVNGCANDARALIAGTTIFGFDDPNFSEWTLKIRTVLQNSNAEDDETRPLKRQKASNDTEGLNAAESVSDTKEDLSIFVSAWVLAKDSDFFK